MNIQISIFNEMTKLKEIRYTFEGKDYDKRKIWNAQNKLNKEIKDKKFEIVLTEIMKY